MGKNNKGDLLAIAANDVINSATPVETFLLGIHPRMLCLKNSFANLRKKTEKEPWKSWLTRLISDNESVLTADIPEKLFGGGAGDVRGYGEQMINMAFLYRLTGDVRYRKRLELVMEKLSAEKDWGSSLIYGHWARGFSFALDWLWHDFTPTQRSGYVETLYARTRHVFDEWASYRSGEPFGYTWNISSVVLGGITATAACLYGERPDIAPIFNMAWEKMRMQSAALGPDGVSPEGVMYGGYYTGYLLISFLLAEELLGLDLFETTPWLTRHARSLYAQTIQRDAWRSDRMFFYQGDGHGHAFGHEGILRILGARLKDGFAQWFADEILESGQMGTGPFSFMLYDSNVKPVPPHGRPPFDFMEDFGIAVMRSDRSGRESACAIKCGPNVGHHAAKRFSHPLGGGHMHPNNGELQIFAHGEWILRHPGYVWKDTSYHNTLLINGVGQYGENSEWFEDLPYRQRRKYPFMEKAEHHGKYDLCIANMTNAYPEKFGIKLLRRYIIYVRPDLWLVIDAIESSNPVIPTQLFHTGFLLKAEKGNIFSGCGKTASCRIKIHLPLKMKASVEEQNLLHTSRTHSEKVNLLRVSATQKGKKHLLVTEIQAFAVKMEKPMEVKIKKRCNKIEIATPVKKFLITPFGQP